MLKYECTGLAKCTFDFCEYIGELQIKGTCEASAPAKAMAWYESARLGSVEESYPETFDIDEDTIYIDEGDIDIEFTACNVDIDNDEALQNRLIDALQVNEALQYKLYCSANYWKLD